MLGKKRYKNRIILSIRGNDALTPLEKKKLYATASNIIPDSFRWSKRWDTGKIFSKK